MTSVRMETDHQIGKKLYYVSLNKIPRMINAEVGALIHNIRSALEIPLTSWQHATATLAKKTFTSPSAIAKLLSLTPMWAKKIKRLSGVDQATIESLRPYKGGNYFSSLSINWTLPENIRGSWACCPFPEELVLILDGSGAAVEFNRGWKGFEDSAPVAWTSIDVPNCKVDLGVHVAIKEAGAVEGEQIIAALRKFAGLVNSIIALFDAP